MKQIYSKMLLLIAMILVGGSAWAQSTVSIATATFNGKGGEYTEGWTTTGTGVTRTDCIVIGIDENITSPEFDFSDYSSVTVSFNARRFGTLTGSKATINVNFGGEDVGTTDATGTNASGSAGSVTFVPSVNKGKFVITCSNATSAGSTHGAGIGTITIQAKKASSEPNLTIQSYTYEYSATKGYLSYQLENAVEGTSLSATVTEGDWISNVAIDKENSRVTFDMEPNTSAERTAKIKLSYGSYTFAEGTVTQKKFVKDFADLPFSIAAGTTSATLKEGDGVTASVDGSDYNNADHKIKFSKNTHYISIKTNQQIGICAFNFRGCAGAGNSSFELLGSADGNEWTSVETFTITFEKKDECIQFYSSEAFDSSYRYVKLAFAKASGEVNCGLGEFTIYPVASYTPASLTLVAQDAGAYYGTFSSDKVTFFPEDYIVSAVGVENGKLYQFDNEEAFDGDVVEISGKEVTGYYVPANTGVLINSLESAVNYYTVEGVPVNSEDVDAVNMLRPASASMTGDYKFYKLAYDDFDAKTALGFYYGAADGASFECPAGLAYLAVSTASAAKSFVLNSSATAINNVNTTTTSSSAIYNLAGQRLSQLQKGINIVDGKKLFVK